MAIYAGGQEYAKAYVGGVEFTGALAGGESYLAAATGPAPGAARQVGSAPAGFGLGLTVIEALAWDGASLFMAADDRFGNPGLYTLDRVTGVATKVADFSGHTDFLSAAPRGMAWDGVTLFAVNPSTDALFTVNRSTAVVARVGSANRFGVSEGSPWSLTWDGENLLLAGRGTRGIYTLDRNTGVATRIANLSATLGEEFNYNAIVAIGSRIFASGSDNAVLNSINRSTGAATRIGAATEFGVGEGDPSGFAWDGESLFMAGNDNLALYVLNPGDLPGTLTHGATRRQRGGINLAGIIEDPDGIASIDAAQLDSTDGRTNDITATWVRRDANSFTHADERTGNRWREASVTVTYTDGNGVQSTLTDSWDV